MATRTRILAPFLALAAIAGAASVSPAFTFEPDHLYTTSYFSRTIVQHDEQGAVVDSLVVPVELADDVKGLAFGTDGLLYVTAIRDRTFAVLALDESGIVHATYPGIGRASGNLSYGKLAVDDENIFVAGGNELTRMTLGEADSATVIFTDNQVYDVEILPSGNLLVASAYRVTELTRDGDLVRRIDPGAAVRFVDVRGVEYDERTDKIFVTHLGYTNFYQRLMRLDAATGVLEADVGFGYADDLFVLSSGDILVGSRSYTPRIYSQDFETFSEIEGPEQMFVTQYDVMDPTIEVTVDIKPGSPSNPVNPMSRGKIPVAILGSDALDVTEIDASSLAFGPSGAPPVHEAGGHLVDVDGDGLVDLLSHYATRSTGIAFGDEEACVEGELLDGTPLHGCDAITTVPACGLGFEAAPLLLLLMRVRGRRARGAP